MMIPSELNHHKHWSVYGIVLEPNEREFLIKIGYSRDPYIRLASMMTALPYQPSLIQTPKIERYKAYALEKAMHNEFRSRNTRCEWFLFHMDDKKWFNGKTRELWAEYSDDNFGWIGMGPEKTRKEVYRASSNPSKRRLIRAAHI